MNHSRDRGFTLVEVLLALVLLVVGVLALVGSSALVSRMIGQGRQVTLAAQAATGRLEWLRQLARSSSPPCTDPRFGSDDSAASGVNLRWMVPGAGTVRQVVLAVEYRIPGGMAQDTLLAALLCR
jgi:prepilin-type N-terminal cleavage/methylation domain-containing protein